MREPLLGCRLDGEESALRLAESDPVVLSPKSMKTIPAVCPPAGKNPERKKLAGEVMKRIQFPIDVQLELLAPWYAQRPEDSHTLDLFDAVPKYPFATTRFVDQAERIAVDFNFASKRYRAEILRPRSMIRRPDKSA